MSSQTFDYPSPERFVVGTLGLPGERTFFLQAKAGVAVTTVVVEKEQVATLAERIAELLDLVAAREPGSNIPADYDATRVDNAGLSVPLEPEFRVGTMSLGWNTATDQLIIECFELTQEDAEAGTSGVPGDDDIERDVLRVVLAAGEAREFVRRADQVVGAGRADCPFCSLPLDPEGHLCPRANGIAR